MKDPKGHGSNPRGTAAHQAGINQIAPPYDKISKPVKSGGSWRIQRHDGVLIGFYASKELAQKFINKTGYLQ